ncbi:UxaA family hydrolase [Halalkalicoccus jeotgali]|uniref:Altronate dehydratase-like protein n=1 Tax=Halalkalicoccus jeotgali (strain DSM 18796 / CECT 7217 / JCM 14584 / KCTC 4019 / B3) TaxID=795797 RepID=D8J6I5_HALJB|nr:UxaA family hydrolase [Halalkalicoccus jeotgali]ADJ13862.1 Altronate dehydratase-like protein [Halalkalicoccus jeotgali B3]ELY34092.1 Altronate dehydratase-like protein [Halalkalicoccus jeotgali B3]
MTTPAADGVHTPSGARFAGFEREDGRVGVRNRVLVAPSVICSHIVAERIADANESAICTPHDHGCAQIGADHEQTERTLLNLARNPNVAGTTVVGLGCEHLQSEPFAERIATEGVPVRQTAIQDAGGTEACIEAGAEATADLARTSLTDERSDVTLGDLTVGVVSSDLDRSTREVADPLVGETVDALLDLGARVVVAGTERLAPHTEAAADRGENDEVAAGIREACGREARQPGNAQRVVRHAASTEFESVVGTWGTASVEEFVPYGARATVDEGLVLVDSPSRFEEAATALAAAGASVVVHVTADGIPTGHPVVPVLKVTGDGTTAEALAADIDLDARESDPDDVLDELARVADGGQTAAERHGLTKFAISRVGPSQ